MPKRVVELGPDFKIDLKTLIETKLLIQANSGGGKSYAIRKLLEATHGLVQQIVIDPEGEFFTLRQKYDYVLAAPKSKECVADLRSASKLPIRLLELGTSAIIDIFELGIHRKAFVKKFCEALVNAPRNLWRPVIVVIDEAHIFCPESGEGTAESKEAVAQFASLGRKRGFCTVLATQRIAKLDKDAAAECNNVMIGRCAVDVDRKRAAKDLGLTEKDEILALRNLKAGQFHVFGPAISDQIKLVQVGVVETKHLKAGQRSGKKPAPSKKVKAVLAQLADLPHEAEEEAKTFADLQRRYRELEAMVKLLRVKAERNEKRVEVQEKIVEKIALKDGQLNRLEKAAARVDKATDKLAKPIAEFLAAAGFVHSALDLAKAVIAKPTVTAAPTPIVLPIKMPTKMPPKFKLDVTEPKPGTMRVAEAQSPNEALPEGEAKILRVAIQYGTIEKTAISTITGYKRQTRDAYISRLAAKGLVENGAGQISVTADGRAKLPNAEPLPTGEKLREFWRGKLPRGELKIFDVLVAAYPNAVDKEALGEQVEQKRQTRDAYLSRMASKKIIENGRGEAKAASTLF